MGLLLGLDLWLGITNLNILGGRLWALQVWTIVVKHLLSLGGWLWALWVLIIVFGHLLSLALLYFCLPLPFCLCLVLFLLLCLLLLLVNLVVVPPFRIITSILVFDTLVTSATSNLLPAPSASSNTLLATWVIELVEVLCLLPSGQAVRLR